MDGKSLDITEEKLNRLKEIIPEAFTENKIDWEKLKAALRDDIEFKNERYVLNWAGKSDAFRVLQSPTGATLSIDQLTFINDKGKVETVNISDKKKYLPAQWSMLNDKCPNVFIEGENLEVLKVLQKSYFGKIKMIYIDPPYNTGNDSFIYPDKFSETREEYLSRIGDKDETGFMTREGLFRKNSKDSGHYHSNWLSMMYPRLFLARNLLRDDGVIFVSIDDNEVHNLRLIMNEVFGEENFIGNFQWRRRQRADSRNQSNISTDHEYIIAYSKSEKAKQKGVNIDTEKYENPDNDFRGPWASIDLSGLATASQRPNLHYDIIDPNTGNVYPPNPNRGWSKSKENIQKMIAEGRILFPKTPTGRPREKKFLKDLLTTITGFSTCLDSKEVGYTTNGTREVAEIFDGKYFDFPKPSSLIRSFVQQSTQINDNDIILDFFAGSCTTAHAVLALNKEDRSAGGVDAGGGNRKFICVQLPEKCDENSEAFKAGYKTIAEIGKERIRRVMEHLSWNINHLTDKKKDKGQGTLNIDHLTDKEKGKTEQASLFGSKESMLNDNCSMLNDNCSMINDNCSMLNDNCSMLNGFKVFKLQESNFKIWRSKIETEEELIEQLQQHLEPLDEKAKTEDVLYELLLKSGVPLTARIEEKNGYMLVNDNEIALMLEKADDEIIKNVIAEKPGKVITLDRLFKNNDQLKTNTALQMRDAGIEFKVI
jgi:adenine-specific DNA-methyltransferase